MKKSKTILIIIVFAFAPIIFSRKILIRNVSIVIALPQAPHSVFVKFPYYAYNQTIINEDDKHQNIPIDFFVVLSNLTTQHITAPDCEAFWPNVVDIEIKLRDGSIRKLKSAGVVSVRPSEALKSLSVPPNNSVIYPVVLKSELFQNLPSLALGEKFFVKAKISWVPFGGKSNFIVTSKWTELKYKTRIGADHFDNNYHPTSSLLHVASLLSEDDDITVGKAEDNKTFDETNVDKTIDQPTKIWGNWIIKKWFDTGENDAKSITNQ